MNEQFVAAVEAALARAGVLRPGAALLVALSGGADSVALLRAVCALRERHGVRVCAAHVEHGLRGEASLADAAFCERLCGALAVPFTCESAALAGGMCAPGAEARARDARYRLLLARARALGAAALLLAHQRDDQAETVLARLIRGSGSRGLRGMDEVCVREGVTLVRPMLALGRADVLAALGGEPFREDETNAQPCCQRNRLRAQALPLLAAENPRAAEHIAQSAALLALDEQCLAAQAEALLQGALCDRPGLLCADSAPLRVAPAAVALRALRGLAELAIAYRDAQVPGDGDGERGPDAGALLALLGLLQAPPGTAVNLPRGLQALAGARHIHLLRMEGGAPVCPAPYSPPVPLAQAGGGFTFGGLSFMVEPYVAGQSAPPDGVAAVALPAARLSRCALRTAEGGERIVPFGAGGGKPLRRYLTDRKVDMPFRAALPLLCDGQAVLWAAGVGAAEGTRLIGGPAALVRVTGPMPWARQPIQSQKPVDIITKE